MKISLSFITVIFLTSCFSGEHKQWNSKKYPDNHFYNFLKQSVPLDTTMLELNKIYTCITNDGVFNHLLFTKDRKVFYYRGLTNEINHDNLKNPQQLLEYFKTQHDTLTIEEIRFMRFVFTKNGKGVFPTYRHLKINDIIKSDSILLSATSTDIAASNRFDRADAFSSN